MFVYVMEKKWAKLVLFAIVALHVNQAASQQRERLFESVLDDKIQFDLSPDNKVYEINWGRRRRIANSVDAVLFLRNSNIVGELDCTKSQTKKIKDWAERGFELSQQLSEKYKKNPYAVQELIQMRNQYIEIETKILDELLSHQKRRFKELKNRWIVNKSGFVLPLAKMLKEAEKPLSKGQVEAIKEKAKQLHKKLTDSIAKSKKEYSDVFRKDLNAEQKKVLDNQLPVQFQVGFISLSVEHLRLNELKKEVKESEPELDEIWRSLCKSYIYDLDVDGLFKFSPSNNPQSLIVMNYVFSQIQSPFFEDLILNEEQIRWLQEQQKGFVKNTMMHSKKLQEYAKNDPRGTFEEVQKRRLKFMKDESGRVLKEFKGTLSKPQLSALRRLSQQAKVANSGMVSWALSPDDVKNGIEINAVKRLRIISNLEKKLTEFGKRFSSHEKEFEKQLLMILDRDQRQLFNDLVGKPLKETSGNPQLLLYHLELIETIK